MQDKPRITLKSWIMIAALGLIWGSAFTVIRLGLEGISPMWLAAARISIGAALTTALWGVMGWKFHLGHERSWAMLFVVGILSTAVPFQLITWAQQHVTSGYTGVSMAAVALIVLPLAHFLVPSERLTLRRVAGFVIGFTGVVMLIGQTATFSSNAELEWAGRIACFLAAGCYALSSVLMRRLPPIDPIGLAAVSLIIGAFFVVPMAIAIEGPTPRIDSKTLLYLAYLGIFPTALGNLLRVLVIRSAGPVFLTLTNYQVPMWSVIMGIWFLGEKFNPQLILSMAVILCGVAVSQYSDLRRVFRF